MNDNLKRRKQRHLKICLDTSLKVESGSTGLDLIELPHRYLPETNSGDVILEIPFPGFRLKAHTPDVPVLAKETGAGIPPMERLRLLNSGISCVDIAGSGGTDWIAVESCRCLPEHRAAMVSFRSWGYSTAQLLLSCRQIARAGDGSGQAIKGNIIASGGLRSPRDFAVVLPYGAHPAAAAIPFIRIADQGGQDGVNRYISMARQAEYSAEEALGAAGNI